MENSKIEWCHHTFDPWRWDGDEVAIVVVASEAQWRQPLKWDREAAEVGERRRVFCASLADVFEDRPELELEAPRKRLFDLIRKTPCLDWLLLTKRPENATRMIPRAGFPTAGVPGTLGRFLLPDNVWVGVSVEDQQRADERIPELLKIPAAVRFLSCEPLLGPVDLFEYLPKHEEACPKCGGEAGCNADDSWKCIADYGHLIGCGWSGNEPACSCASTPQQIHWVIVGGESGGGARDCRVAWIRPLVRQCASANVPCFVKQLGAAVVDRNDMLGGWEDRQWPQDLDPRRIEDNIHGFREEYQGADVRIRLCDKKGGDMAEWPEDLRVRQFPATQ